MNFLACSWLYGEYVYDLTHENELGASGELEREAIGRKVGSGLKERQELK